MPNATVGSVRLQRSDGRPSRVADKRAAEAKKAQAAARSVAHGHEARAETILATPAALSGDACASAQARMDGWLKGARAMRFCARPWAAMALCAVLAGCGAAPLQPVKTPVPIERRVQRPARSAMPTEALTPGVDLGHNRSFCRGSLSPGHQAMTVLAYLQP